MGLFRMILAMTIISSHMNFPQEGPYYFVFGEFAAVRLFFMISGFYMSLVFITKYSQCKNGASLFLSNRALRIYPAYFAILIFAIISQSLIGRTSIYFTGESWSFPDFLLILSNIFIFGLSTVAAFFTPIGTIVIGPAWTLGEEAIFYLLVPFIIFKRPFLIGCLFVFSLGLRFYFWSYDPVIFGFRGAAWSYSFFPTNLVFFLLGHIGYLIYSKIKNYEVARYLGITGVILLVAYIAQRSWAHGNAFLPILDPYVFTFKGYVFYFLMTLFIPFLFLLTRNSKVDRFIGNFSFSTYLLGTPVIFIFAHVDNNFQHLRPYIYNHLSIFIVIFTLAYCIHRVIEKPIERIRERRTNNSLTGR